jgi:hypothetical protein
MQSTPATSEISLAITAIGLGAARLMEWLTHAEPALAAISYIAAALAAIITIYYKIKNKGK